MRHLHFDPGDEVYDERVRAHEKHAPRGSMEVKTWNHPIWLPVLTEEVGEVAKELCEQQLGNQDKDTTMENIRKELIQVAAMSTAWIAAIDALKDEEDAIQERGST